LILKIRHPSWADRMEIRVNGKKQKITGRPGSYVDIDRTWRNGDKIEVSLPMRLRAELLPGSTNIVALLYGPIVLAGKLGTGDLPGNGQQTHDQLDFAKLPVPSSASLRGTPSEVLASVKPAKGAPLAFRISGTKTSPEFSLAPFYRISHERYAVYWELQPGGH
jgi:DUF1680 family protein